MLRPALIALAAITLSGCATFDNTDVAAKVGDADLSEAELERRAASLNLVADGRLSGDGARDTIANWIGLQLADEADIVGAYLQGPIESGITCVFAVPAPDAPTADGWVARLDGGEAWSELLEEVAPEIEIDGRVECLTTDSIGAAAEQMAGLSVDDPYRSLVFDDGSVIVIRMQSLDDVNGFELLNAALTVEPASIEAIFTELDNVDVEVSPRYGTFDPETISIRPLG